MAEKRAGIKGALGTCTSSRLALESVGPTTKFSAEDDKLTLMLATKNIFGL